MKNVTLSLILVLVFALVSCGDTETKNDSEKVDAVEQAANLEQENLLTQENFEKVVKGYGLDLYPEMKFKSIKQKGDDIVATYSVADLSVESKQKVADYIAKEFAKKKEAGWGVNEHVGIAMKKENEYKIGIEIGQAYNSKMGIHNIVISYGKVY